MKLYLSVFLALALTGILNVSCLEEKAPVIVEEVIEEEEHVVQESFVNGKILRKTADLCLLGRDRVMHSLVKLSAGTDISVLALDGVIDVKVIPDDNQLTTESLKHDEIPDFENKTVSSETDSASSKMPEISGTEYFHVVYDNLDFWLEKSVLAFNCENAVAVEKTFMYSDAALTQKIDSPQNPLKFASSIAKSTEESAVENTGTNSKSAKIFYYDTALKSVREAYVLADSISTRKDDIVVSQVVESLKATTRAVPRNELFAKAAKYKPCQKVLTALNAQKVETKTYNYQEVLKSMQRMSFGVNVDELLTVDQSKDPFK